jgi:hypothetical protein
MHPTTKYLAAAVAGLATLVTLSTTVVAQQGGDDQGYDESLYADQPNFEQEDYHVVEDGDTLFDLSGQYLGDERAWPRLWSFNPHITNPHWIYPGDVLYLTESADEEKAKEEEENASTDISAIRTGRDAQPGLSLATGGFVTTNEPKFVGRIVASPKEARLLGQYDSVWIGFGDDAYSGKVRDPIKDRNPKKEMRDPGEVRKQDRFAIVRDMGEVENGNGDTVGRKYLVLGSLVVTKTSEKNLETGYIDQSWREISRGDLLIPFEKQLSVVQHVKADRDLVATIIGSLLGHFDFGESHYVFLNKGASDGIRTGNRLYVYQRGPGLDTQWRKKPDDIPWRRVGRVRVVDVKEEFSTAVITDSKREISIGDRLEMYQGN